MASKSTVHQFKIELIDTHPSIWRQIQVPSTCNMFDLHGALNDAMGWSDYHFHVFKLHNHKTKRTDFIGRPFEKLTKGPLDGRSAMMANYFTKPGDTAEYWYDFGDRWEHKVVLEKILPADADKCYPVCINGKRACPPEDCGGTDGYDELLRLIKNKTNPNYAERMKWLKEAHNLTGLEPQKFHPADVHFRPSELRKYPFNNTAEAGFYDCIQM